MYNPVTLKAAAILSMLGNPDDIDVCVVEEIVAEALRGEFNEVAGDFRRPGENCHRSLSVALWRDAGWLDIAQWIQEEAMRRMS